MKASVGIHDFLLNPNPLKVYLVSTGSNKLNMRIIRMWLAERVLPFANVVPTWMSKWVDEEGTHNHTVSERALIDLRLGVLASDLVIAFAPFGEGSISEIAVAVGAGIPVVVVAPQEYMEYHSSALILGLATSYQWCAEPSMFYHVCDYDGPHGIGCAVLDALTFKRYKATATRVAPSAVRKRDVYHNFNQEQ